ncbi:MAG: hypothetical protein AAB225_14215 [Acidobacteriota bacterium]
MQTGSIRKVGELPVAVREAIESMLGRVLHEDESVSIKTYRPKEAPEGPAREAAYRRLLARVEKTARRARDLPEAELDPAVDEAVDSVRHHPK